MSLSGHPVYVSDWLRHMQELHHSAKKHLLAQQANAWRHRNDTSTNMPTVNDQAWVQDKCN